MGVNAENSFHHHFVSHSLNSQEGHMLGVKKRQYLEDAVLAGSLYRSDIGSLYCFIKNGQNILDDTSKIPVAKCGSLEVIECQSGGVGFSTSMPIMYLSFAEYSRQKLGIRK